MNFYCKQHPDFEALNLGQLHDHIEKDHAQIFQQAEKSSAEILRKFTKENIEADEARRSDQRMVVRTWGRPPKMGQFVTDSEIEKK